MGAHAQSVRAYLAQLEACGWLQAVADEVDPRFEISAHFCLAGAGPALRFERVAGHDMRVFGNLLCSRERIALGLGSPLASLQARIVDAIRAPLDGAPVDDAPCQEVAVASPDLATLPVPTFFEHETGPYLTAGAVIARDPDTGRGNLSFARLKPLGGNRALIGIAPHHHLAIFAQRAQALGKRLPIAVTLGNHPAVMIAGALYLGLGEDELRVAGALCGAPLQIARTANGGLAVPAHCEIVLEGEIDAGADVVEGPVSEYHGMYEDYGPGVLVEFSRMTHRRDAMLQVIQPGYHPEHVWIGGEAIAASLAHRLRSAFPGLGEVAVTPGGAGRLHAVAAIDAPRAGDAHGLARAICDAVSLVKFVTVVDAGVDPWDAVQVERALATCMRADRDLLVLPAARTSRSDPLEDGGRVAKLAIDATRKPGDRADWRSAAPPAEVLHRIAAKAGRSSG